MSSDIRVYTLKRVGTPRQPWPRNREEPHSKVLLPRGACCLAPQPGMKLVHGPMIIGDSKNTGAASTTFLWGSKGTANSESSDTWLAKLKANYPKAHWPSS